MSILLPSYRNGYASRRNLGQAENPELWDGLAFAWGAGLGNTGTVARDVSGYGRNGVWSGTGLSWETGQHGYRLRYNGDGSYLSGSFAYNGTSCADWTVCFWAQLIGATDRHFASSTGVDGFRLAGGYAFGFDTGVNSLWFTSVTSFTSLAHYAMVCSKNANAENSNFDLYVNGSWREQNANWPGRINITKIGTRGDGAIPFQGDCLGWVWYPSKALPPASIRLLASDPHALFRLRPEIFPAAVSGGGTNQIIDAEASYTIWIPLSCIPTKAYTANIGPYGTWTIPIVANIKEWRPYSVLGNWNLVSPTYCKSTTVLAGSLDWLIQDPSVEKIADLGAFNLLWSAPRTSELKTLEPDPGAGLGMSPGHWNILFNGLTSVDLSLEATATEVYDAIFAIIVGGGLSVVAKEAGTFPNNGGGYRVTFDPALGDVALMAIDAEIEQGPSRYTLTVSEVSGYAEEVTSKNEVATINVPGTPGDPWTFKLGKTGETQAGEGYELSWSATASEVQAAIDYLYGTGAASTSGGPLGGGFTPVVVTWNGSLAATNVPDLFVSYAQIEVTVAIDEQGRAGVAAKGEVQDLILSISPCLVPAELAWGILSPTVRIGNLAFKSWLSKPTLILGA